MLACTQRIEPATGACILRTSNMPAAYPATAPAKLYEQCRASFAAKKSAAMRATAAAATAES